MVVKILRGCLDLGFGYRAGTYDLPADQAKFLIEAGRAVPVAPEKKVKEPEVKTAVVEDVVKRPVRRKKKDEV
jgi:hypothetical protein